MADIESRRNPEIRRVKLLLDNAAQRKTDRTFVCHGSVALSEAIKSGAEIKTVYALDKKGLPDGIETKTVSAEVLELISGVENSRDVVFTVCFPASRPFKGKKFIALCSVRDPGNVGTVIRTADAFGMDGVVLVGSCADPFSPKTVRSTAGSLFRVPLFFMTADGLRSECEKNKIDLYAAELSDGAERLCGGALKTGCVMIGNEAHGLSDEEISAAHKRIMIPIKSAESLNAAVAAAVFMWEMSR